ncbi:hypothetical protein Q31a_35250 [Aureliella helgolandensis]|uniref:Uncharacterized protein n=1 Tax=Aureliella helgolandensis TaxID=2527968 RepID=A0A518G9E9_9BACT|nr:hypothetical protein Q31a_35250 [Aureliella helgolandensis]
MAHPPLLVTNTYFSTLSNHELFGETNAEHIRFSGDNFAANRFRR